MNESFAELKSVEIKTKAVKGAGINIAMKSLSFVCHTIGVIVLARLLTPKDFGLVAMVTAFSLWIMNFGFNGFTEYIIQKQRISEKEINSIFWVHFSLATLFAFGFTYFGLFLASFYAEPALTKISIAMAASFIFQALFTSHFALLKRDMKFTSIAITEFVALILSIIFAITVALAGMGYWAIVTRQLTIPAVTMLAAWFLCSWRPGRPQHISSALPGLKYAIQVYYSFTLGFLTRNIDKVLLGKFHGAEILGNYDRAIHLSSMPANQFIAPLHSVALATLSRLRNDTERFSVYYTKALSIVAFIGTILSVILTLLAQDLILLLLGPEWTEAGRIVMVLAPGIAPMMIYETNSWLHLSLGAPNRWLRWNIFASIITITAFIFAAPFGAVAMGAVYSAKAYALFLPALLYAGRPIRLNLTAVMGSVWTYFASGFFVFISFLFISKNWSPLNRLLMDFGPINRIVLTSCIVLLLYLTIVIILQRSFRSIREIASLIRLFLSRGES